MRQFKSSVKRDPGISCTLQLMTLAMSSAGAVLGSLCSLAAGVLAPRSGFLPRLLADVAIGAAIRPDQAA